jgi:hypothetical protein
MAAEQRTIQKWSAVELRRAKPASTMRRHGLSGCPDRGALFINSWTKNTLVLIKSKVAAILFSKTSKDGLSRQCNNQETLRYRGAALWISMPRKMPLLQLCHDKARRLCSIYETNVNPVLSKAWTRDCSVIVMDKENLLQMLRHIHSLFTTTLPTSDAMLVLQKLMQVPGQRISCETIAAS